MGPDSIVYILEKVQLDTSVAVRAKAVEMIRKYWRPESASAEAELEFLAKAARDPDSAIAVTAMESLGEITGVGRDFDSDWWRRWWERRLLERPEDRGVPPPALQGPKTEQ
jgi:carbamoylphosphate synthase large subunit